MRSALACCLAASVILGAPAAGAQDRETDSFSFSGPLASCDGFDVIGQLRGTSTVVRRDGRTQIRLRVTGTLRNSLTGLTGRYAEVQVDRELRSGTAFSAGLLSRLTVPGRGTGPLAAGRGGIDADGDAFLTPGAAGVEDPGAFLAEVCERLA